jgi:hypothetical protein
VFPETEFLYDLLFSSFPGLHSQYSDISDEDASNANQAMPHPHPVSQMCPLISPGLPISPGLHPLSVSSDHGVSLSAASVSFQVCVDWAFYLCYLLNIY